MVGITEKRLAYIDFAKAIGMMFIMWGHIRLSGWSNSFVYAFHIPLFFFLSGMVFSKDRYPSIKIFVNKKIKSLIIPYAIFSFITWAIWAGYSYMTHSDVESYWMPLAQTFIAQGSGGFLVHNVPLWFVTCLFVVEVLYYFMSEIKHRWFAFMISCVLAIGSYLIIKYCKIFDFTLMPWNVEVAFLALPFYVTGNWVVEELGHQRLMDCVNNNKLVSVLIIIIAAVIVYVGSRFNGSISFGHADMGKSVIVTYVCAFTGIAMTLMACMLLAGSRWNANRGKLNRFMKWFGMNSFNAMAIHNPIKGFITVAIGALLGCGSVAVGQNNLYSFFAFCITLIVTLSLMALIDWFKTKMSMKRGGRIVND